MATTTTDASASTQAPTTETADASTQKETQETASISQDARSKATPRSKPFPSITGGCLCNTVRYRLLTSPLFCYACHCPDCQRISGTVFAQFLNIEIYNIQIISPTPPVAAIVTKRPGLVSRHVECPNCKVELWSNNLLGSAIADVRVGTLDFPSLMEPDVHAFIESKVEWIRLPEGAKVAKGRYDHRKMWPESSLRRMEICLERWAAQHPDEAKKIIEVEADGEKTPTATDVGEDDEAFEKRFKETEKALQERLEMLSRKLEEEDRDKGGQEELQKMTEKLDIGDVKDGIVSRPVD